MTKKVLSAKLKAIRGKFREAVDSARRSGHGRVVLLYYELCEKIWEGSPATQQLDTGIESIYETDPLLAPVEMVRQIRSQHGRIPLLNPLKDRCLTTRSRQLEVRDNMITSMYLFLLNK